MGGTLVKMKKLRLVIWDAHVCTYTFSSCVYCIYMSIYIHKMRYMWLRFHGKTSIYRNNMDAILVPVGIILLVVYHVKLIYQVLKLPTTTVIGVNQLSLQLWVTSVMKGKKKADFVVQTMRNSIMSSSLLTAGSVTMSTMIGAVLKNCTNITSNKQHGLMLQEDKALVAPPIKLMCLLGCFLLASLCYMRSVSFYSHANVLLAMPFAGTTLPSLTPQHFQQTLIWGAYFRLFGTRALYFSLPFFVWMYGPIPMFCGSIITIIMLHFQDIVPSKRLSHSHSDTLQLMDSEGSPLLQVEDLPCIFCAHH